MRSSSTLKHSTLLIMSIVLVTMLLVTLCACGYTIPQNNINPIDGGNTPINVPSEPYSPIVDENGNAMEYGMKYSLHEDSGMVFCEPSPMLSGGGSASVTIAVTVSPANAGNKDIVWSYAWTNASSTWATGKAVASYVTVTPTSQYAVSANVSCLQAFGEQITITAASRLQPDVTATCTVDYLQRASSFSYLTLSMNGGADTIDMRNVDCATCGGDGLVACTACTDGHANVACTACTSGVVSVTCATCNGLCWTGETENNPCPACVGGVGGELDPSCEYCHGTGSGSPVQCTTCNGVGTVETSCTTCGGDGIVTGDCPTCGGDCLVACTVCHGLGYDCILDYVDTCEGINNPIHPNFGTTFQYHFNESVYSKAITPYLVSAQCSFDYGADNGGGGILSTLIFDVDLLQDNMYQYFAFNENSYALYNLFGGADFFGNNTLDIDTLTYSSMCEILAFAYETAADPSKNVRNYADYFPFTFNFTVGFTGSADTVTIVIKRHVDLTALIPIASLAFASNTEF